MIFKDAQSQYEKWAGEYNRIPLEQVLEDTKNIDKTVKNAIEGLTGVAALTGNLSPSLFSALLIGFYFRDWLESEKKKETQDQKECDILDVLWKRS